MLCAADTAHLAAGLRRFSTKLWPLESEDEIVALILGMARYPVDTPDRAEVIAADMQTKHASTTINVLVSSIESEAGISALVDLLASASMSRRNPRRSTWSRRLRFARAEGVPCGQRRARPSDRILHARAL